MRFPVPHPNGTTVIEVEDRTARCLIVGCGGGVVRHSLGAGQSVDRCTRCFRRYQVRAHVVTSLGGGTSDKSRLRRMFDEFVTWRED